MRSRKDSGFTLLEMIIVLAVAGGIMVSYAFYARKKAETLAQQNVANSLVTEMNGVITFAGTDEVDVVDSSDDTITNPLYDKDNKAKDDNYGKRIGNELDTVDTGSSSDYLLWGNGDNKLNQQRYLFLSSNCKVTQKSGYEFKKTYLPCFMSSAATNSLVTIDRVGFFGGTGTTKKNFSDISRIDVIVRFKHEGKNSAYQFANYYTYFAEALNSAGLITARATVLHRNSTSANWSQVVQKKDNKTPVEFGSVANNMDALTQYTSGEFGARFSFNLSDNQNSSGGGGGGSSCWVSKDVTLCYDKEEGQGEHGEDAVLALNMTDKANDNGNQMTGTLKANIVMENTSRRVYLFKRSSYSGDVDLDGSGNPIRYTYADSEGKSYEGDFVMDDENAKNPTEPSSEKLNYEIYTTRTYDAFELLTPVTSEYHTFLEPPTDVTGESDYTPSYDDSELRGGDTDYGPIRIPVQSCPQIKQSVALRDGQGKLMLDENGKTRTVELVRKLYPRLSTAMSSVVAYNKHGQLSEDSSTVRNELDSSVIAGQLAGVTTQIEFTENNETYRSASNGINTAENVVYEDFKYLWVISASLGVYDGTTGKGATLVNPPYIAYTVSRWCSTIPQPGTPADILDTYQYK